MKVYFYTLGCKVNQYETQEMIELFENAGHTIIYKSLGADICVINSCTVTAESVRKTRQTIRKLKKQNPDSIVILTGCASQAEPHIINDLPEVDILMGTEATPQLLMHLIILLKQNLFVTIILSTKRVMLFQAQVFHASTVIREHF